MRLEASGRRLRDNKLSVAETLTDERVARSALESSGSWLCEVLALLGAKVFVGNFVSGFVSNVTGLKDVSRNRTLTSYDGPIDVVMHLVS